MSWLSKLERSLRPYAVPHVTLGLIVCQAYTLLMMYVKPEVVQYLILIPNKVLDGEVWRLATFVMDPPCGNVLCALFSWFLFYLMGTALESYWGVFRYNLYLLIGYLATVGVAFLTPDQPVWTTFLMGSVFLAFAFLNPDFELYLFFLLPVKIKWLARLAWLGLGFLLVFTSDWGMRWSVLASVANFLLFFGKELLFRIQGARRRMAFQARRFATPERDYFHRCTVCGITDRTHPQMEFRYCSQCAGAHGYCTEHLRNHEHVTAPQESAPSVR